MARTKKTHDDRLEEVELGPSEVDEGTTDEQESIIDGVPLRSEVTAVDFRLALELIMERATTLSKVLSYLPPNMPVGRRDVKMLHFLIVDLEAAEENIEDFLAANRDLDVRNNLLTDALTENMELRRARLQDTGHSPQQREACNGLQRKHATRLPLDPAAGRHAPTSTPDPALPPAGDVVPPTHQVRIPVDLPEPPIAASAGDAPPAVETEEIDARLARLRYPEGLSCEDCRAEMAGKGPIRWCVKCGHNIDLRAGTVMARHWLKGIPLAGWADMFQLVSTPPEQVRQGSIKQIMDRYDLKRSTVTSAIAAIRNHNTAHPQWLCQAVGVPYPLPTHGVTSGQSGPDDGEPDPGLDGDAVRDRGHNRPAPAALSEVG